VRRPASTLAHVAERIMLLCRRSRLVPLASAMHGSEGKQKRDRAAAQSTRFEAQGFGGSLIDLTRPAAWGRRMTKDFAEKHRAGRNADTSILKAKCAVHSNQLQLWRRRRLRSKTCNEAYPIECYYSCLFGCSNFAVTMFVPKRPWFCDLSSRRQHLRHASS